MVAPAPTPVIIVTPQATAPVGAGSYCYWVVANFTIGKSNPSAPGCLNNAGASVTVNWNAVSGASSYDVLRTATPILPNVTANIAVATSVAGSPLTDGFGALSSYTINTVSPASALFLLDNQNQANPAVRITVTNPAGYFSSFLLGASGGNNLPNTVSVSPNCAGALNCFTVFDDAQVAMTANYTSLSSSGGTTATALTTHDNDAGGEWLQIGAAGPTNAMMSLNNAQISLVFSLAFKTTGTVPTPTCWGSNENGGSSTTATVAITPTGGSGHILVAMTRGQIPGGTNTMVFSDPSNTWTNILSAPFGTTSANMQIQTGYATNIVGGSYTLTATFAQSISFTSIYACEFSNVATSAPLDGFGVPYVPGSTTVAASGGFVTTAGNDLVVAMGTDNSSSTTWTAGPVGFTSTVTTLTSDPPFTSADVGKKILGSNNCGSGNGFINCTQSFYPGVIASVTSAHIVQVNGLPSFTPPATGTNFTGWFVWGHDDGVQIKAAWNAALLIPGSTLILPCGSMMVGQPPFLSTSIGGVYNPNISGCVGTTLIPTADYDYSQAVGGSGIFYSYPNTNETGFGANFQNPYSWSSLSNFTVWGGGVGGEQRSLALPLFNVLNTILTNVAIVGWNWNPTVSANAMPAFKAQSAVMRNVSAWSAGAGGLFIPQNEQPGNFPNSVLDSFFGPQGACAAICGGTAANRSDGLVLQSGYLTSRDSLFFPADGGQTGHGATISGGFWTSVGDQIGLLNVTGSAHIFLKGSTTSLLNAHGLTNAGGLISAQDSQIDSLTQTSGSFIDEGGNYSCSTQPVVPCGGTITRWSTKTISGGTFLSLAGNATTFSAAPACSATTEGSTQAFTDSTVNTWGSAIAGSGTNHVLGYCDGSSWKVAAP